MRPETKAMADGVLEALRSHVREAVAGLAPRLEALEARQAALEARQAALPPPRDGRDGATGAKGEAGTDGRDGRDGAPGAKGEAGTNGADGRDGTNGRDGVDGLGFDDLVVEYDGERAFSFSFVQGERVKTFGFRAPFVIDRGVYRPTHPYEKGDGVTFGGAFWIAQKDDPAGKPGEVEGEWRLAVKKGRDGKDGAPGKAGEKGERGLPGLDGRRIQ